MYTLLTRLGAGSSAQPIYSGKVKLRLIGWLEMWV